MVFIEIEIEMQFKFLEKKINRLITIRAFAEWRKEKNFTNFSKEVLMKLSELKPGNRAKIVRLKSSDFLKRRLMDMGLVPGEVVYVEKVAPLGDPIEIVVKNYHLSLRKNEAEIIEIEEVK